MRFVALRLLGAGILRELGYRRCQSHAERGCAAARRSGGQAFRIITTEDYPIKTGTLICFHAHEGILDKVVPSSTGQQDITDLQTGREL